MRRVVNRGTKRVIRCFKVIFACTVSVRSFLDRQIAHCSSAQSIGTEHIVAYKLPSSP